MKANVKVAFAILLIIFMYTIFPAPLLQEKFWGSKSFVALTTVSGILLFIFSIGNNVLLVRILWKVRIPYGSVNYLMMVMCIADILYPVFYLPLMVSHTWLLYHDAWLKIDIELFFDYWRFCTSAQYLAAGVSASAFTLACTQRAYTTMVKKLDYVAFRYKFVAVCLSLAYGTTLFIANQEYTDYLEWVHIVNSVVIVFFPLTMNFIALAALIVYQNLILRERTSYRNLNYVGLYGTYVIFFVCWTPLSMVETLHLYVDHFAFEHYVRLQYILPVLFILKSPLNLMITTSLDKRFMIKLEEICNTILCRKHSRSSSNNGQNNNGGEHETFHMYSELQEFHLSHSRIDMYTDSSTKTTTVDLRQQQHVDNSDITTDEADTKQLIVQDSV